MSKNKGETTDAHVTSWMVCRWSESAPKPHSLTHNAGAIKVKLCREKDSCAVYLSTHPVGYSGTSATHGRGMQSVAPKTELPVGTVHVASFAFQAFVVTNEQMTSASGFLAALRPQSSFRVIVAV